MGPKIQKEMKIYEIYFPWMKPFLIIDYVWNDQWEES